MHSSQGLIVLQGVRCAHEFRQSDEAASCECQAQQHHTGHTSRRKYPREKN